MCERIALLLEVVGFFTAVVLVAIIKWPVIKPTSDKMKAFIVEAPAQLAKITKWRYVPALILLVPLIVRSIIIGKEERKKLSFQLSAFWRFILYWILFGLISFLFIPLYVLGYAAKLLSGHNIITNVLLFLGTSAILAGLIIKVIINW